MSKPKQECMYCEKDLRFTSYEYFQVREAVKPPKQPSRYNLIGYCCETCHDNGKAILLDPWSK